MSRPCGHPLDNGGTCAQPVADSSRPDCGRHRYQITLDLPEAINPQKCAMHEPRPGVWLCLVHDGPEWEAAQAMGAAPPCRVPLSTGDKCDLAQAATLDPCTAWLLFRTPVGDAAVQSGLASNESTPILILEQLSRRPLPVLRSVVAGNPSTPPTILRQLAHDPEAEVWSAVAGNPAAPLGLFVSVWPIIAQRQYGCCRC